MTSVSEGTKVVPSPNSPDWIDFLRWYARMGCPADIIIDIVEKPWQYSDTYAEYLAEGGLKR